MLEHEDRLDSLRNSTDAAQVDTFYEVTIASVDQPKLLSRLSEALVSVLAALAPFTSDIWFLTTQPPMLTAINDFCCQRCPVNATAVTSGGPEPQHC